MKKLALLIIFMSASVVAYGMYDFCESPSDYNTFPQAYDVRTEYWKDIPNYHPDDIKFKDMENEHPIFPIKFKKKSQDKQPTKDN